MMQFIYARNVNDAWLQAIDKINSLGVPEPSRAGNVLVCPTPVMTMYSRPMERVLFDPTRDANPIFHLHEAIWMLAGRNDATWLDQFVSDFSVRFAEPGGRQHGAYGHRWRYHFGMDQLDEAIRLLRANPKDRQAVVQMWDPNVDLGVIGLKDRPCNTQIYLRIVDKALNMGVMCRSNDIVWGCYGANAVHFAFLQEYLAAMIGVGMGTLSQYSWNWHMYENTRHLADSISAESWGYYPGTQPLVTDPETIDMEIRDYVAHTNPKSAVEYAKNTFLRDTAYRMYRANELRKEHKWDDALAVAADISAPDWQQATVAWLQRRKNAHDRISHD